MSQLAFIFASLQVVILWNTFLLLLLWTVLIIK